MDKYLNPKNDIAFKRIKKEDLGPKDNPIKRAFDELDRYSWSDEELARYEAQEKRVRDNQAVEEFMVESAEAKGREEGIAKGRKEVVKKLQALGFSPQKIEEIMG